VLIEHGDGAELWAQADTLRGAGYQVATCKGPTGADGWPRGPDEETLRCPLIDTGQCTLASGADVVVCDCGVGQSDALVRTLAAGGKRVVFQAPAPQFARYTDVPRSVQLLAYPVTEQALLDAVNDACEPSD